MKIIHTSDWHLGQKFLYNDREAEHELALNWLLDCLITQNADGLIVAGDIFDIGNPPNYARSMYYRFLRKLINTSCRHILFIGGNHDSPAMLHAPRELLEAFDIRVIGSAGEKIEEEIVEWKNEQGAVEAVIAAVPFLRDRDLRYSVIGEGGTERLERVRESIKNHYREIGELVAARYAELDIPKIATGHLYATGAEASAKQDNIYIGDTENISADHFPEVFQYVALGHIHRAQLVGGKHHIRYSGSIIPLSFSETQDDKSVYLLTFEKGKLEECKPLPIPVFRRLKTIEGTVEEVESRLQRFGEKPREGLLPWVEIIVHTDRMIPQLDQRLHAFVQERKLKMEILKIRVVHDYLSISEQEESPELNELETLEVFQMKCKSYGAPPDEMEELVSTFLELQSWLAEKEEEA
jgi:exonuclease SbcD